MKNWVGQLLRGIIAIALAGSLVAQAAMVLLLFSETDDVPRAARLAIALIGLLGVGCLQLIAVCVWKLLTMVRRGTVFSDASFRYVDCIIAAIAAGGVLIFAIGVVARYANHSAPADVVAPGMVGFVCGMSLVAFGVAMVVYVMRTLLTQAVSLDSQTKRLQSELDEVI